MRFGRRSMPESRFALFGRFRRSHEFWLLIVILALCASLGMANAQFLTVQNLFDLMTSYACVGILALGLLVVLIAGGIYIYSLPDWSATGISWLEFEWGKDTSYGVNLQILVLAVCFLLPWLLL